MMISYLIGIGVNILAFTLLIIAHRYRNGGKVSFTGMFSIIVPDSPFHNRNSYVFLFASSFAVLCLIPYGLTGIIFLSLISDNGDRDDLR